eukprot:gene20416-biopygen13097
MDLSQKFYRRIDSPPLGKGVVDGTQGCPQKMVFPVSPGAAVTQPGWGKDACFLQALPGKNLRHMHRARGWWGPSGRERISRCNQNPIGGWGPLSLHWGISWINAGQATGQTFRRTLDRQEMMLFSIPGWPLPGSAWGLATGCAGLGVNLTVFLEHFDAKTLTIISKHAPQRQACARSLHNCPIDGALLYTPQRRVYPRSLPKGPIDGTHGCAQKWYFQFAPGRLLERACARKMRISGQGAQNLARG